MTLPQRDGVRHHSPTFDYVKLTRYTTIAHYMKTLHRTRNLFKTSPILQGGLVTRSPRFHCIQIILDLIRG